MMNTSKMNNTLSVAHHFGKRKMTKKRKKKENREKKKPIRAHILSFSLFFSSSSLFIEGTNCISKGEKGLGNV